MHYYSMFVAVCVWNTVGKRNRRRIPNMVWQIIILIGCELMNRPKISSPFKQINSLLERNSFRPLVYTSLPKLLLILFRLTHIIIVWMLVNTFYECSVYVYLISKAWQDINNGLWLKSFYMENRRRKERTTLCIDKINCNKK